MPPVPNHCQTSRDKNTASQSPSDNIHSGTSSQDGESNADDEPTRMFVEHYPKDGAGAPVDSEPLEDFDLVAYIGSCGPFVDRKVFCAAELLVASNLTKNQTTEFLESKVYQGQVPWHNWHSMIQDVDALPAGPNWSLHTFIPEGARHTYVFHAFKRDVIQVVRELIGNPKLKWDIRYTPGRHWTSVECLHRIYNKVWTSEWWWEIQYMLGQELDEFGTIAALIVSSDKSCMSTVLNGKHVYLVYVTLGNISKSVCRKASSGACVLLGYLPVESFMDEPQDIKSPLRQQSFHLAITELLKPLKEAWRTGVEMRCADGRIRRVHPTLAAFEGNWPEQCDMAKTLASGCLNCEESYARRGDLHPHILMRDPSETLATLLIYREPTMLKPYRLRPGWPFWADLWPIDLHNAIVPDLLHQIYVGMYKDHLVSWATQLIGKAPLDWRFGAMPEAEGLRHFPSGISTVQRWTGRECREMAKVILPMMVDKSNGGILKACRSLLDFCYLAHSASMTDIDLADLDSCLRDFHESKLAIFDAGLLGKQGWNRMPKLHMLSHYTSSIH